MSTPSPSSRRSDRTSNGRSPRWRAPPGCVPRASGWRARPPQPARTPKALVRARRPIGDRRASAPARAEVRLALCQMNATVGDIAGNAQRIRTGLLAALDARADLVLFPELSITGYPPEDLL